MERHYTTPEIAKLLQLKRTSVTFLLTSGKLRGRKIGQTWRVTKSDLNAYLAKNAPLSDTEAFEKVEALNGRR